MKWSRSRGFTLIEVLIASVILFAVITVVTDSYRSSIQSDLKSRAVLDITATLPLIVSNIRETLRRQPDETVSGSGRLLGVDYSFTANTANFKPPPARFDPDAGEFRNYPNRYRLYSVELELVARGQSRAFEYKEVAWLPAAGI
jgi:prepilin-type N-terminal cleavage/methylation domain-containing protein